MIDPRARVVRPRIGLLPIGHFYYWEQFPRLKAMGERMYAALRDRLESIGDIVAPPLVDTAEKSEAAGRLFRDEGIDLLFVFPFGYAPSMTVVPAAHDLDVPIRILNAHEDRSYPYATADTTDYLHHEGVCCVPEIAGALMAVGKELRVRTGPFDEQRLWGEVRADAMGAAAARAFGELNFGLIGQIYPGMSDMPVDEHRLLRATGKLLVRPEVEEIEEAFGRVTPDRLARMVDELRAMYEVDGSVTDEHMRMAAQLSVAYDEVIRERHAIDAFGYYWWGEKDLLTQLRAESGLAASRLAALGRPGVTEGDVKTAMAMKVLDLLGGGGMFTEFFAMDFDGEFLLMGHDGPGNIAVADGPARLRHLDVHHGKSGHGLGIDFDVAPGVVTLLNLTQVDAGDTFKLIYSVAEVIPGDVLAIGNPNCRVRVSQPLHDFMDAWCRQGPSHHIALGIGDHAGEIEAFCEAMRFGCARV